MMMGSVRVNQSESTFLKFMFCTFQIYLFFLFFQFWAMTKDYQMHLNAVEVQLKLQISQFNEIQSDYQTYDIDLR